MSLAPSTALLAESGFAHVPSVFDNAAQRRLADVFANLRPERAGKRIAVASLPRLGELALLVTEQIGAGARPVRAILFDKHEANNWALGWHQDRTIAVQEKRDVHGFGPWTVKDGCPHVAPPISLLERMITVRIHLDPVDDENAPLLVAPGSHRYGLIAEREIANVVAECGQVACHAQAGDAWLYATPILHASARALRVGHRRVLQLDYSADELPGGLAWAVTPLEQPLVLP